MTVPNTFRRRMVFCRWFPMELALGSLRQNRYETNSLCRLTTPDTSASLTGCFWSTGIRSVERQEGQHRVSLAHPAGDSASVRRYLFHPNTSKQGSSTLFGAMYPDDHLILEDGIWRLWNLSLDEPYFEMPNWKGGW